MGAGESAVPSESAVLDRTGIILTNQISLKALSYQTSSHYILLNGLRMGWLPEDFEQVQNSGRPRLFTKFIARPGSSYYIQEICAQFEPVQTNVVKTSLV